MKTAAIVLLLVSPAFGQLVNPGFELPDQIGAGGLPRVFSDWDGNTAVVVGAEQGIAPFDGNGMLRFMYAHEGKPTSVGIGVGVRQFLPASEGQRATASARFNRVAGDSETDTEFHLELEAYGGTPDSPNLLQSSIAPLLSDGDVATWELVETSLVMPPGTSFLGVHLLALENVKNDSDGEEFDGHYVDAVSLTVVPEPTALLLVLAGVLCSARRIASLRMLPNGSK
jgi:hypothetical protein